MTPPSIETSTREERQAYVREKWECMHNCELCGKCHVLKGRDEEILSGQRLPSDVCASILVK